MTNDPIEQRLRRYTPSTPPSGFKNEILDAVICRVARKRAARIFTVVVGALLLSGVLAQVLAGSNYRQAIQLANGRSRPVPRPVMVACASAMGIHVPDSGIPLGRNGG